jgi:DNA-binding transcriptional ArsR family regulator
MLNIPPPLWKTCRIIACETRLKLLWSLFKENELNVTQLTLAASDHLPNISIHLRLLAEHGLVVYRRENMNVFYRAEANFAMEFAPPLLDALRDGFQHSMSFKTAIRQATALSHGRRVEIIQVLKGKSRSFEELQNATGMSSSALSRHLFKLIDRGFVEQENKAYRCGKPGNRLGRMLTKLASRPPAPVDQPQ